MDHIEESETSTEATDICFPLDPEDEAEDLLNKPAGGAVGG